MVGDGRRSSAREYATALLAGLLGAVGVIVGTSRPWVAATAHVAGLPVLHVSASGADLAPVAGALGVVMLGAFAAVIATRGWVRRLIGGLIAGCATVVIVSTVHPGGAHDTLVRGLAAKGWTGGAFTASTQAWRWVVLLSALVCLLSGVAVAWRGGQWATMGSRYDAPRAEPTETTPAEEEISEAQAWQAIDSGHDPTERLPDRQDTMGARREEPRP